MADNEARFSDKGHVQCRASHSIFAERPFKAVVICVFILLMGEAYRVFTPLGTVP